MGDKVDLCLVVSLEFFEDTVRVELRSSSHIGDVRAGGGRDTDPSESGDTFCDGGKIVGQFGSSSLFGVLDGSDGTDGL